MEMFDLVEVPEEQHGVFFAGDCYVILYAYRLIIVTMIMRTILLSMKVVIGVMLIRVISM